MADNIHLEIVTPNQVAYSKAVDSVVVSGIGRRLLVTNIKPVCSHQFKISGSSVPFAGVEGSPTIRITNSGCRRLS